MAGSGASAPTRTASLWRAGPFGALSRLLVVLLVATAVGASATPRDALAARSPSPVRRHATHHRLRQVAGRVHTDIVGGQDAAAGSFPWLAFIVDNVGGGHAYLCSGAAVSSNLVLTAGHCAEDITTGIQDPARGFG